MYVGHAVVAGVDCAHDPDGEARGGGGRMYGVAIFKKMVDEDEDPFSFAGFGSARR